MIIDWNSPTWGRAGQNTHESSTGSWLEPREDSDR